MSDEPSNKWEELAALIAANKRPHAGHFSWETNRAIEEGGVVGELQEALENTNQRFFFNPRHRGPGNDPPDCEADGVHGGLVALETTELVDPKSAAAARAGKYYDAKDWRDTLIPELQKILKRKDGGSPKGGPYSEYVLVIYSDESCIELDRTRRDMANHVFERTNLITRAFFLLSYSPFEKGYPCIPLRIEGI